MKSLNKQVTINWSGNRVVLWHKWFTFVKNIRIESSHDLISVIIYVIQAVCQPIKLRFIRLTYFTHHHTKENIKRAKDRVCEECRQFKCFIKWTLQTNNYEWLSFISIDELKVYGYWSSLKETIRLITGHWEWKVNICDSEVLG